MYSFSKKIIAVSAAIFVLSASLFAQNSETNVKKLTVEDAVKLALENNITVKQSKLDLDLLAKKNKYSWNSIAPSFSLSGGLNGGKSGTFEGIAEADSTLSWSASGSVRLSFAPSLATSIKAAKLSLEAGELSYEAAKRQIELGVRKTFYSLVYFHENTELQERSLETAKQTYESNKTKFEQGRLAELVLLNSQYAYESKIPTVANLQTTYESNLDSFKSVLGLDLKDNIELIGSLDDFVVSGLEEKILATDIDTVPAIKTLNKNIESAQNSLAATRMSAYGPSLSLNGSASTSGGLKPESDPRLSLSYGATVSIPLDGFMPWSSGALNVASQKENLEKLKLNLEQTKATTALQIRNSVNSILQSQKQLELLQKNAELMLKTYDMTRNSYNVGSADLLSLQTAENNLYSARYNVQNQRYSIISAVLDLESTLGIEFGSLSTNK